MIGKVIDGFVPLGFGGNQMIKLIAIDLDGTLLHEDKTLSKGNIEALHWAHEAGYDICDLCTGRPLAGYGPSLKRLDSLMATTMGLSITGGLLVDSELRKSLARKIEP